MRKALAVVSLAAVLFAGASVVASDPMSSAPRNWAAAVKNESVTIATSGEVPNLSRTGITFQKADGQNTNPKAKAYWITPESSAAFKTMGQVARLKEEMENGKVLMFLGEESPNQTWSLFGVSTTELPAQAQDGFRQLGFYLWQDLEGQIQVGTVYGPNDASAELVNDALLEQTINHTDKMNHNLPQNRQRASVLDFLTAKRAFADVDSTTGWVQKNFQERNWQFAMGNKLNEFFRSSVIPNTIDSDPSWNYVLIKVESQMVPAPNTDWESDLVRIQWTGNNSNLGALDEYGPHAAPGSTTVGIGISVGGSEQGWSGEASFTREWTVSALNVTQNSDWDTELYKVTYDYDGTAYAKQTTLQISSWVIKVAEGYPMISVCVDRRAEFSHWFYTDEYVQANQCNSVYTK